MNVVTREEKKFLISIEENRNKPHYLDNLMIQDEHNGINGYIIRSLYFDTPYDDFVEKLGTIQNPFLLRNVICSCKNTLSVMLRLSSLN